MGIDRSWVIPLRDLVDSGLLPTSSLALSASTQPAARTAIESPNHVIAPTPATAHLAEALAENRGLHAELARAQGEIEFLRALVVGRTPDAARTHRIRRPSPKRAVPRLNPRRHWIAKAALRTV
ncbi:MAG: hypothetical protein F2840_16915 [Actinobacteria bacterium]|uniref:Unannotated protein n=1 Tax=freshwater metagenome TaxID=449393 RepID=A0A6J7LRG0_9ZZZZ|nr:hypothetical protein [Actinomycetota bacterium]